jgi:tRNA pseudouridine38-40 synthase
LKRRVGSEVDILHAADGERRIRLLLEYDGTDFSGWQRQRTERTVQGVVEQALEMIVDAPLGIVGAGRTDAGCHARGQVAHVSLRSRLPAAVLGRALNAHLPADVRVRAAEEAPPEFHARFDAIFRRYDYLLVDRPSALWRRYAYEVRGRLDPERIRRALGTLVGRHDFRSFCRQPEEGGTECVVQSARWGRWSGGPRLSIVANRFLRGMVRTIVGTVLEIGMGRRDPTEIASLLDACDRRLGGPSVPAHGLYLVRVAYPADAKVFGAISEERRGSP